MFLTKKTIVILLSFLALFSFSLKNEKIGQKKFDPDAGLVPSALDDAQFTVSSNQKEAYKILDKNTGSAWQSEAPLPEGFIKNKNQNILLNKSPEEVKTNQSKNWKLITDGNLNNNEVIDLINKKASLSFSINKNKFLSVSLKCLALAPVNIFIISKNGHKEKIGTYSSSDNYQLKRFEKKSKNVSRLYLESASPFSLFEIAALESAPKEHIIFELKEIKNIGSIKAKCWAGKGASEKTMVYSSLDGKIWNPVLELDPEVTNELLLGFAEHRAAFLKIEHTLKPKDWNKVYLWEVELFDKQGPFGERPTTNQGAVTIGEMLGVNGYWSWGTDQYSFLLGPEEGPRRFKNLISHARNYHDMTWDITRPDQPIDFSQMSEKGTPAKEWVNWDLEYQNWKATGMDIQASFQFYRFSPAQWKQPEQSAYNYAKSFVSHFGIDKGNGLVCSVEAGNEPWKYPADIYQKILKGIIKGVKEADSKVEILPCALQAADPAMENTDVFKNYIGARVTEEMTEQLDGVNSHCYSYIRGGDGKRKAVHPEHPLSTFWEINNMVRWRGANMPDKKIYLSEWGWDCNGGGEVCVHDECVSEEAAAAYAVRGLLIASRLGIERATWYYYANEKMPSSLYTRSGLVSSFNANFQKKKPFNSLQALVNLTKDAYFQKVVKEDETAWMYLLGDISGTPTHLVAWLPIDGDSIKKEKILWKTELGITGAWLINGEKENAEKLELPKRNKDGFELDVSPFPMVFELK